MKASRRDLLATAARLPALLLAAHPAASLLAAGLPFEHFDENQVATLKRMTWLMFPIEGVAESRYREAAWMLQLTPDIMTQGVAALDELAGGQFIDLPEDRQVALMKEMEGHDFFTAALEAARISVLNDKDTWALIGYDGSSLEFGGYLDRGLADIDWLPELPESAEAGHE